MADVTKSQVLLQFLLLSSLVQKSGDSPSEQQINLLRDAMFDPAQYQNFPANAAAFFSAVGFQQAFLDHLQLSMFTPEMLATMNTVRGTQFFDEYDPDYCWPFFTSLVQLVNQMV